MRYAFKKLSCYHISDLALLMPSELNIFFGQSISSSSLELYAAVSKLTCLFFESCVEGKKRKGKGEEIEERFAEYLEGEKMRVELE